MNRCTDVSVRPRLQSLGHTPGMELLGHVVILFLAFWGRALLLYACVEVPVSYTLANTCCVAVVVSSQLSGCEVALTVGLSCVSLMIGDKHHLCLCPLAIGRSLQVLILKSGVVVGLSQPLLRRVHFCRPRHQTADFPLLTSCIPFLMCSWLPHLSVLSPPAWPDLSSPLCC